MASNRNDKQDFGTSDIINDAGSVVKNVTLVKGIISFLSAHPLILAVIAILILIVVFIVINYLFLFGFSFKIEQSLEEIGENAYLVEADSNYNEYGYYIYQDKEGNLYFCYLDEYEENSPKKLLLEEALKEAYCVKLLIEGKDIDISTDDTLLLDDSDMDKILDSIIKVEQKRKEKTVKNFTWLEKIFKYGTHQEPSIGADGSVEKDHMGNIVYEEVENDYPEWLPSDEWNDKNMSAWFHRSDSVELRRNDIEGELDPVDGTPRFMVHWQVIAAICEMTSTQNYDNWGNTGDPDMSDMYSLEYGDADGYYLDDSTVQRITEALSYKFTFHWDGHVWHPWYGNSGDPTYSYEEMEKNAYRLELKEMAENPQVGDNAYIKKIPETAPAMITNIYEYYIYHYEPVEDGYGKEICTGRSKYINAIAFVELMAELCPQFDFEEFIEIIAHFPVSEAEVEKYTKLKGIYEWQLETGEPYYVEEDNLPCFSTGVRLGTELEKAPGLDLPDPGYGPINGTDYVAGDFDYVWLNEWSLKGKYYEAGWYAISEGAKKDLRESDGLTQSQVQSLLHYIWVGYGSDPDIPLHEAAEELYRWQEDGGGSITAVLAIWRQEGSVTGTIGKKGWNFSNMTPGPGDPSFFAADRYWVDFKTKYNGDLGKAMVAQFERISKNYWNNARGQYSFYNMCFNTSMGPYNAQTPEEAYSQRAAMVHCYCPYWEDYALRTMPEKVAHPTHRGWANNCALFREQYLSTARK